jgi:c-di-AMP phosphodiesterase-like protein
MFNEHRLYPCLLLHLFVCLHIAFTFETKDKQEFLEKKQSEDLQKDLKSVLEELPEGIIISTKYPHE